ncbi:hypothetical protein SAMN02745174_02531 [Cetobacterium ceti]|uniref:Uncharacterized protein n=1 Tax=Cetobacterium ceti TaxID=180163 RepID=A0A1T4R0A5_9FUSO|nr:hypothetical protein [Cetobacterium ceti]SKA09413.1 hypothetical protein SAMN02745174_02531 [Cetobacterium ceti]
MFIGITFMPLLIVLGQIALGIFILYLLVDLVKIMFVSIKIIMYILIYSLLLYIGFTYYGKDGLLFVLIGIGLFEIYPFLKKKM